MGNRIRGVGGVDMNNQEWLVNVDDAAEVIESLYQIIQRGDLTSVDLAQADEAYERFRRVRKTSSVPKPGDRVQHSDLGEVRIMDTPTVRVLKDKEEYEVYLHDLEVTHE